jgi:hypothetical protein
MARGGHNWKGGGTVEGRRCLDIMKLARADLLAPQCWGTSEWRYRDGTKAQIQLRGGSHPEVVAASSSISIHARRPVR